MHLTATVSKEAQTLASATKWGLDREAQAA